MKTLCLLLGLMAAGAPSTVWAAPPARIAVLGKTYGWPAGLGDSAVLKAEQTVTSVGFVVARDEGESCTDKACYQRVARNASADLVLVVGGQRTHLDYTLHVEVWRGGSRLVDDQQNACPSCTDTEVLQNIGVLTRAAVLNAFGGPSPAAVVASPPVAAVAVVATPTPAGPSWWQPVLTGTGVVTAAVGLWLWTRDGNTTDCETSSVGIERCHARWQTHALGGAFIGAGLVGAGVGVWAWTMRGDREGKVASGSVNVAVGPQSVFVTGRF